MLAAVLTRGRPVPPWHGAPTPFLQASCCLSSWKSSLPSPLTRPGPRPAVCVPRLGTCRPPRCVPAPGGGGRGSVPSGTQPWVRQTERWGAVGAGWWRLQGEADNRAPVGGPGPGLPGTPGWAEGGTCFSATGASPSARTAVHPSHGPGGEPCRPILPVRREPRRLEHVPPGGRAGAAELVLEPGPCRDVQALPSAPRGGHTAPSTRGSSCALSAIAAA